MNLGTTSEEYWNVSVLSREEQSFSEEEEKSNDAEMAPNPVAMFPALQ